MRAALGLIEAVGLTTAITALDAASKAADVKLVGFDKVIGVEKTISVTIHIAGEVAAVRAAVDAGVEAANRIGKVVSSHVIPRPHDEIDKLMAEFEKNLKAKRELKSDDKPKKIEESKKKEEATIKASK
ncbi:microcompartments protein [Gottschalkia purinilytica]|uniref:Microcompartments protein n=1 Tax=Gottschalkia purinilytica TaxID=1503 RepID=A0A0L0W6D8_GOTPU|nr:BMC domain-containing protein [Gottschalkia purinilytica]KNF07042.1 microcompartments protein [Gottschalkia purinilytica]